MIVRCIICMTTALILLSGAFAQTGAEVTIPSTAESTTLTFEYIAGGDSSVQDRYSNVSCAGWIADEPDHVLTVTETMPFLRATVRSNADTIMLAYPVDASGNPSGDILCNDDTIDTNPELSATPWLAGRYYIFVGSYSGDFANYTITFSSEPR